MEEEVILYTQGSVEEFPTWTMTTTAPVNVRLLYFTVDYLQYGYPNEG